ncbi:MAG: hypothetical protein WB992_09075 [Bryobacteraceae bacterium]
MTASKKILSVRLAVPKRLEDSLDDLQGSLADVDVNKLTREERKTELARERRLLND